MTKNKVGSILGILFAAVVAIVFLADARNYMDVFLQGASVWAQNVLPALLPFALLSKVILSANDNYCAAQKTDDKLLKLSKAHCCTIIASLLCGYPIGAKLCTNLPQTTAIQRRQKSMLTAFCSTAGPVFLIGTVGGSFLQNTKATAILIGSHYLGALLNGVLYSFSQCPLSATTNIQQTKNNSGDAMIDSLLSVTAVGGYIAFFYVLQAMLTNLFATVGVTVPTFLIGLLEMTGGCYNLCNAYSLGSATVLCCTLISFGGICVLMQCYPYLKQQGYTLLSVLRMKVMHGALSTIICFALCKLFSI